ncbi:MAG: hypothetical protein DBY20_07295 [Coriobacteriia bacterium]|nr:MAG: hypothetical protein DBY20_07295 [Coriobacteriia bacterium]
MIKKRLIACFIAAIMSCTCLFAFAACGSSDANELVGEWKIKDTEVTVVFSGDKFKLVGNTFDYTIDPGSKTITYKSGDATGEAKYSFGNNDQQLTLDESDGAGGTKTTVFDKVSNNGDAEPSANGAVAEGDAAVE